MSSPDAPGIAPTVSDDAVRFGFENSYARLPEHFYARLDPTPVTAPRLVKLNVELARELGLDPDALASTRGVEILSGNRVAEGAEPLAQAYAGHQFGHFVPQLGDGRTNLLGEVLGRDGRRYDIQLKGSGPTPFSRGGDGRAALGPVLREYIVSEAMAALGVPTTRALAAVTTGERVLRETALPGAVLTRVAASHLRVGTFQYFAAHGDTDGTHKLADYAIGRHYPEAAAAKQPYRALLDGVITRQAELVARWLLLGFIHGVMNTDNTSISGETIDYGPCAFMEAYDPVKVFSSIDHNGRYAYGNQPRAMLWNLTRLAEALLPVHMIDWIQVFVRAQGDPMSLETDVRRQIANVNPGQQVSDPVFSLTTRLEQESAWARSHLLAVLSSIFSVLALILTSVGLYSVISYTVSQRVNEFGIRIALGAERHHILLNVLQSQTRPLGAGLLIGLFLSVGAHRLLAHLISSTPTDLWTLGVVCLVFLIVSLLASVIPAIQASRRPPMDALRME